MYNERLKALRKSQNLTQAKLADALRINRTTYTNYELGKTEPSIRMLIAIAHALNTTVDYLVGFSDNTFDVEESNFNNLRAVAQERERYSADRMDKLNDDEQLLVIKYRNLPKQKKNSVFRLIERELDNVMDPRD